MLRTDLFSTPDKLIAGLLKNRSGLDDGEKRGNFENKI
jgi:hypothetical protein